MTRRHALLVESLISLGFLAGFGAGTFVGWCFGVMGRGR